MTDLPPGFVLDRPRQEVPSTARVWGDKEAEAAGLYADPNVSPANNSGLPPGFVLDKGGVSVRPYSGVEDRFAEFEQPKNEQALASGLRNAATQAARGPEAAPGVQMLVDLQNQQIAGGQQTTPLMGAQMPNLVSTEVHESDSGFAIYRDPETGQMVEVDKGTQVVLRDPADNRLKVFQRTPETDEGPLDATARILSPGLAAGAVTARPAIPAAARSIQPRASDTFATAKPFYRAFDREAARAAPIAANEAKVMVDRVQNAMDVAHYPAEVAKQVHDTVSLIGKRGDTALQQLQYVKRAVGNLFKSPDENVRNAASVASKEITRMIAEQSRSAAKNLRTADEIHSTARAQQELQRRESVAGLRKGRAGYGGNAVNSMRQVLSPIVEASIKGRKTPFKPDEIAAMREIVEGTGATNVLRMGGQLSPSKGIFQTAGAAGAGLTLGPEVGVAIAGLGAASNKLAAVLTGKQIERLKDLVAKRSPAYSDAVRRAVERYERAQIEFVNDPSPNRFAAYLSASRALSSGLNRDGIQVASGELLRAIQGPVKSAADDEQPEPERVVN